MEKPIKCTCCDSILVVTHQERYQDLAEHVSNPNGMPSLKDGYQCPNEKCIAHNCDVTWIADGDCYFSANSGFTFQELKQELEANHGTSYAVDSWNYHYELGKQAIKRLTWSINLYWFKFVFEPREKGWNYGIEKRHMPNIWNWKMEIWKRDEHGWTHLIPTLRMVRFCVKQFNFNYERWKETGMDRPLEEAYRCVPLSLPGKTKDNRLFVRLASKWIQMRHPMKTQEVWNAYIEQKC